MSILYSSREIDCIHTSISIRVNVFVYLRETTPASVCVALSRNRDALVQTKHTVLARALGETRNRTSAFRESRLVLNDGAVLPHYNKALLIAGCHDSRRNSCSVNQSARSRFPFTNHRHQSKESSLRSQSWIRDPNSLFAASVHILYMFCSYRSDQWRYWEQTPQHLFGQFWLGPFAK